LIEVFLLSLVFIVLVILESNFGEKISVAIRAGKIPN
jgi:hypothetical protein